MRLTKHEMLWVTVVAVVVTAAGAAYRLVGAAPSEQKGPPPAKVGDAEAALKKAMLEDARKVYEMDLARYRAGQAPLGGEELHLWSVRWLEADLDLTADATARTAALKAHVDRMKEVEKMATNLAISGQGRESDAAAGRYYRAQAELWAAQGRVK